MSGVFMHSHSTMYLLKRSWSKLTADCRKSFTFHHVSIKTQPHQIEKIKGSLFTFHHVSIKTKVSGFWINWSAEFTFHHVSIKTRKKMNIL